MATGTIELSPLSAILPDGSSGNAAPALTRRQGSEANPKKHFFTLDFDPTTDEHAWWTFRLPVNWASGLTAKVQAMANAASTNVARVGFRIGAVTPGDADTPVEHAQDTAVTGSLAGDGTEARRLLEGSYDLSAELDGMVAGDRIFFLFYRDADATSGTDSMTVDLEVLGISLEYTTT